MVVASKSGRPGYSPFPAPIYSEWTVCPVLGADHTKMGWMTEVDRAVGKPGIPVQYLQQLSFHMPLLREPLEVFNEMEKADL